MTDINPIIRNLQRLDDDSAVDFWKEEMATRITDDPQAHVDALVEAGVLQLGTVTELGVTDGIRYMNGYTVVHHRHDWRIARLTHDSQDTFNVYLECVGCLESTIKRVPRSDLPVWTEPNERSRCHD
jgi:hypothetical protein